MTVVVVRVDGAAVVTTLGLFFLVQYTMMTMTAMTTAIPMMTPMMTPTEPEIYVHYLHQLFTVYPLFQGNPGE